jgi:hypothetical protein
MLQEVLQLAQVASVAGARSLHIDPHTLRLPTNYFSFAYSALACFRIGMSGSAFFQRVKKS